MIFNFKEIKITKITIEKITNFMENKSMFRPYFLLSPKVIFYVT